LKNHFFTKDFGREATFSRSAAKAADNVHITGPDHNRQAAEANAVSRSCNKNPKKKSFDINKSENKYFSHYLFGMIFNHPFELMLN